MLTYSMSNSPTNSQPREIEFKFAVNSAGAFKRLIKYMGMPESLLESGILQVNHFFDTDSLSLYSTGSIVRLREQNGRFKLTVKEMSQSETSETALSHRMEYESVIEADIARELLRYHHLPLDRLKAALSSHTHAITALLKRCGVDQDLNYIGHFINTRTPLPVTLKTDNQHYELIMEFDASEFPGSYLTYEIEVEISTQDDAADIGNALEKLLADAGIDWYTTSNKAARFFNARSSEAK